MNLVNDFIISDKNNRRRRRGVRTFIQQEFSTFN